MTSQNTHISSAVDKRIADRNNRKWRQLLNDPATLKTYLDGLKTAKVTSDDAEKEYCEWCVWLNSSVSFCHGWDLYEEEIKIADRSFEKLFIKPGVRLTKIEDKKKNYYILCANLIDIGHQRFPLSISLNQNNFRKSRYRRAGYFLRDLISTLENANMIGVKRGIDNPRRVSRIWPTESFLQHFQPQGGIIRKQVELVVLRDESKHTVEYKDTAMTKSLRAKLIGINLVNSRHPVQLLQPGGRAIELETSLHTVFNGDFRHGGRFYTTGLDRYQGLGSEERKNIIIGGEPVVELDFCGMQPRMLYAFRKIQYNNDPYSVVYANKKIRKVLKIIMLAMLNAKNELAAEQSGNKFIRENLQYYNILKKEKLKVKDIINKFKEVHKPIANDFFNKAGLMAMFYDSQIALEVICEFTEKGLPILAVHDSFIVQERYENMLREAMDRAYTKITNWFTCPIDK